MLHTSSGADLAPLAGGSPSPLERPTLGERLALAGRSLAVVSGGTAGSALLLHPLADRLSAFCWNVNDTEGATAARVRERLGHTPAHAVPNVEGPGAFGLPGTAPFDAGDVLDGGGMHGGLHRRELATLLLMQGGPFRRAAVVQPPPTSPISRRRCCTCLA